MKETSGRLRYAGMCVLLAATALAFQGPAWGQTQSRLEARVTAAVKTVEAACRGDLARYCSTVTPGEGRILLCLEAHADKISDGCDYALFQASRNLDRALDTIAQAADACGPDIDRYCSRVPEGGGRVADCLSAKKDVLSKRCFTMVDRLQKTK